MEVGELGGHRLADDDGAGGAQLAHDGGILVRPATGEQRRAAFGRIVGGVEDVLDPDRNAVQRTEAPAFRLVAVERARLRQRMLGIEVGERLDFALAGRNPVEAGARVFLRGDGAPCDLGDGLRRRELGYVGTCQVRASYDASADALGTVSCRTGSWAATASCP